MPYYIIKLIGNATVENTIFYCCVPSLRHQAMDKLINNVTVKTA